jgi:hypothetical protein
MAKLRPLTKGTWVKKYKEELDGEVFQLWGYAEAVVRQVPVLEKMVNTAKDFEELKAQILKFTKQQMDVVKDIEAKQEFDPTSYGLPNIPGFKFTD